MAKRRTKKRAATHHTRTLKQPKPPKLAAPPSAQALAHGQPRPSTTSNAATQLAHGQPRTQHAPHPSSQSSRGGHAIGMIITISRHDQISTLGRTGTTGKIKRITPVRSLSKLR